MLRPSLDALLQGAGEAAVVCDRSRRPVMANAAAQRLMAEGDGLGVGVAGLYGASFEDTKRLRAGFDEAERIGSARLRLNRQSGRPPLLLRLVSAWNVNLAASKGGSTVLFISEPDAPRPIDREAIAEAFHLTRREAEVAALLAGGASPAAIAQQLGVAVVSVRIYLKRIFAKTEARSQAALVAMIRGFV
jgi:DNA-binding CsgD family transcriptional regulator